MVKHIVFWKLKEDLRGPTLEGYVNHPDNLAMLPLVREVRVERSVGDYEV